jgi:hypothetical protein
VPDSRRFLDTPTVGKPAPMFVKGDSSVWTYFTDRCFNGDPFTTL